MLGNNGALGRFPQPNSVCLVVHLCESSKYVYLGRVGFELHRLNASRPMLNATAGEHYSTGK